MAMSTEEGGSGDEEDDEVEVLGQGSGGTSRSDTQTAQLEDEDEGREMQRMSFSGVRCTGLMGSKRERKSASSYGASIVKSISRPCATSSSSIVSRRKAPRRSMRASLRMMEVSSKG